MGGEWSLVAFTITGQLAAGLYFIVGIPVHLGLGEAGVWLGRGGRLGLLLAVLCLLAVATALSLFHLRHPVRACRSLLNLGRSWLSREILALLSFMGAVGTLAFFEGMGVGGPGVEQALFILGGLAGLLFLLTMSKLYMLPSVPAWNRFGTPLSFVLTSAVLGACAAAFWLSLPAAHSSAPRPLPQPLLLLAVCGIAASLLNAALLAPVHGLFGAKPHPSLRPPGAGSAPLHAARLLLLAAGGAVLAAVLAAGEGRGGTGAQAPAMLAAAFLLAAAGEVSGRFLFYGLPGRRSRVGS